MNQMINKIVIIDGKKFIVIDYVEKMDLLKVRRLDRNFVMLVAIDDKNLTLSKQEEKIYEH